ncbi:MAG: twin-arginine translocation pathway signal protein [Umezawaea sp.]
MHDDDEFIGRVLSRRKAITLLGAAGAVLTAGGGIASAVPQATPKVAAQAVNCVVKPQMTQGPFYVDEGLNRSDIRTDPSDGTTVAGTKLTLNLSVLKVTSSCASLQGATVDLWQCDAYGRYSDVADNNTVGKKFLRGYQVTNSSGLATFVTILPGWYTGRTVHFHIMVRTRTTSGSTYKFTSQLFFTEEFKAVYLKQQPYLSHGVPNTTNSSDGIYRNGGSQMLLTPAKVSDGYTADFAIGLNI